MDDLFEIIEPEDETKDASFVQDDSFVNSLDFFNDFSENEDKGTDVNGSSASEGNPADGVFADMNMAEGIPADGAFADMNAGEGIPADEAFADMNAGEEIPADGTFADMNAGEGFPLESAFIDMSANEEIPADSAFLGVSPENEMSADGILTDEEKAEAAEANKTVIDKTPYNSTVSEKTDFDEEDDFEDELDEQDEDPLMVITEGTVITGSVGTDCDLLVLGTVNGDITCEKKLTISGKVVGNSFATDVFVNSMRVEGNIGCTGTLKISQGTVVIGDITASAAAIGGAIKGNLDINGPVILDSTAVIKGNIKAKSVQLINGAVLEGFCSLEYSDSKLDQIFDS